MADPDLVGMLRAYHVGDAVRCPEGKHASVESTARRMARGRCGKKSSADLSPRAEAPDRMERKQLVVEPQGEPGRHDVCCEAARLAAPASELAPGPDSVGPLLPAEPAECREGVSGNVGFVRSPLGVVNMAASQLSRLLKRVEDKWWGEPLRVGRMPFGVYSSPIRSGRSPRF